LSVKKNISAFKAFQLSRRFFTILAAVVVLYFIGFFLPIFMTLASFALVILVTAILVEIYFVYSNRYLLVAHRSAGRMMSLGDENPIKISIKSQARVAVMIELLDEVPYQFQSRDLSFNIKMMPGEEKLIEYKLRPVERGEYHFGFINVHINVLLRLVSRRMMLGTQEMVPVMPSVIQMHKYELMAFARITSFEGIKKLRRLGHSYEFEKIKQYNQGDDIRSINWKATGRKNTLMVNQYEDERSQQVYMIVDKSRNMHMPFNGLTLLDYSINTSLVLSNIALKKYDKTGLITFSYAIGSTIPAERSQLQLKKIMNALYHEKPQPFEANYDLLYRSVKNIIKGRSLIMLYSNFESMYAMERALPVLQKINKQHLLVVLIFENTELHSFIKGKAEYVSDIYAQTITQKLLNEKKQIVAKLRKYGIQTILSKPEDLSINTVNKYLELKAKGLI
jgi:uncharacterized protein (DUF58 family)